MTPQQAERIIGDGLHVKTFQQHPGAPDPDQWIAVAYHPAPEPADDKAVYRVTTPRRDGKATAIKALVEKIYKLRCQEVFENQNWRCCHCGRLKPLQVHHIKHRSQGRDDRVTNLEARCESCHREKHESSKKRSHG